MAIQWCKGVRICLAILAEYWRVTDEHLAMCGKNDIWYGSKICKILYKTTRQKCEQTETDLKTDRNDPLRI